MTKKIGLALGSGGALGFSHIGVIRALVENEIPIDYISGSSAGAIVGAYYSLYKNIDKLEEFSLEFSKEQPFKLFDIRSITDKESKERKVKLIMEEFFRDKMFGDLKIPFSAVSVDLESGEEYVIKRGRLVDAVFASMSVPGVFGPTFYWGHWLVDGGLSNPTPVSVAKDMGADFVIGVDLTKKITKPVDKKPGVFSTIFRSIDLMISNVSASRLNDVSEKLIIYPKFKKTEDSFTQKSVKENIATGYNTTIELMPEIKKSIK